jgi:hypothetical protein
VFFLAAPVAGLAATVLVSVVLCRLPRRATTAST